MTKKRLSDLVRQEAQKSLGIENKAEASHSDESQGDESQGDENQGNESQGNEKAPTPKSSPNSSKTTNRRIKPTQSPLAKATTEPEVTTSPAESPQAETVTSTSATPSTIALESDPATESQESVIAELAELKGAIADLETALKTSYQTESTLRQNITQLESEVHQQQDRVQTLTTELEQADRHKAELEQTKQLILTLSDNNIKIAQELDTLKRSSNSSNPLSLKSSSSSRSSSSRSSSSHSSSSRSPSDRGLANLELRKILEHPILVEQPSTDFSDAEIGWVD